VHAVTGSRAAVLGRRLASRGLQRLCLGKGQGRKGSGGFLGRSFLLLLGYRWRWCIRSGRSCGVLRLDLAGWLRFACGERGSTERQGCRG
jgi:hypothetical protein